MTSQLHRSRNSEETSPAPQLGVKVVSSPPVIGETFPLDSSPCYLPPPSPYHTARQVRRLSFSPSSLSDPTSFPPWTPPTPSTLTPNARSTGGKKEKVSRGRLVERPSEVDGEEKKGSAAVSFSPTLCTTSNPYDVPRQITTLSSDNWTAVNGTYFESLFTESPHTSLPAITELSGRPIQKDKSSGERKRTSRHEPATYFPYCDESEESDEKYRGASWTRERMSPLSKRSYGPPSSSPHRCRVRFASETRSNYYDKEERYGSSSRPRRRTVRFTLQQDAPAAAAALSSSGSKYELSRTIQSLDLPSRPLSSSDSLEENSSPLPLYEEAKRTPETVLSRGRQQNTTRQASQIRRTPSQRRPSSSSPSTKSTPLQKKTSGSDKEIPFVHSLSKKFRTALRLSGGNSSPQKRPEDDPTTSPTPIKLEEENYQLTPTRILQAMGRSPSPSSSVISTPPAMAMSRTTTAGILSPSLSRKSPSDTAALVNDSSPVRSTNRRHTLEDPHSPHYHHTEPQQPTNSSSSSRKKWIHSRSFSPPPSSKSTHEKSSPSSSFKKVVSRPFSRLLSSQGDPMALSDPTPSVWRKKSVGVDSSDADPPAVKKFPPARKHLSSSPPPSTPTSTTKRKPTGLFAKLEAVRGPSRRASHSTPPRRSPSPPPRHPVEEEEGGGKGRPPRSDQRRASTGGDRIEHTALEEGTRQNEEDKIMRPLVPEVAPPEWIECSLTSAPGETNVQNHRTPHPCLFLPGVTTREDLSTTSSLCHRKSSPHSSQSRPPSLFYSSPHFH